MSREARHCRHCLELQSITSSPSTCFINIMPENLVDGFWYSLRLNHSFPALNGTEVVFLRNGSQEIQMTDWRGRALLSERLLRGGERLRMVFTENGPGKDTPPVFLVREGIVCIP